MSDIFISYASEDRTRIKPLVNALQQRGWTVWWDRTILAGQVWERVIESALAGSRCVIVAWSAASVGSEWVWMEAGEGKRRGVLVPVMLDQVVIPLAFRRIHAASLVGWRGELQNSEFEELASAVAAVLARSGAPKAAAAAVGATPVDAPVKAAGIRVRVLGDGKSKERRRAAQSAGSVGARGLYWALVVFCVATVGNRTAEETNCRTKLDSATDHRGGHHHGQPEGPSAVCLDCQGKVHDGLLAGRFGMQGQ